MIYMSNFVSLSLIIAELRCLKKTDMTNNTKQEYVYTLWGRSVYKSA